jgi:hypothetical protein
MRKIIPIFFFLLFTGIPACSPGLNATTPKVAPTNVTAPIAAAPTSVPIGDSFDVGGFVPQSGILIDTLEDTPEWIDITWFVCKGDGFVLRNHIGSSKTVSGRKAPVVVRASSTERQELIESWQEQGYMARITDKDGKVSEVSNLFIVHDPPLGYEWVPPGAISKNTSIQILIDGQVELVDFNKIQSLTIKDGDLIINLIDGSQLSGAFAPYTHTTSDGVSVPFRARLYGIQAISEGQIKVFELPINEVRSIEFLS